jgi:hypothetical protein
MKSAEASARYSREYRRRNPEKIRIYNKWYRETHPDKVRELGRAYKASHPEKAIEQNARRRLRRYGISEPEFQAIRARQHDSCAICKKPLSEDMHIDHNHDCCPTKRGCPKCVRGILCVSCNLMLGSSGDNINTLRNAVLYLESFTAKASATVERII